MRTNAELEAENAELKAEVAMLAAGQAAKAAEAASAAAAASGKKACSRSEFEAKPADVRRKMMLSGEYVLYDDDR
jgi:septal ring factor EnvC (AmiA/AmiB activator)